MESIEHEYPCCLDCGKSIETSPERRKAEFIPTPWLQKRNVVFCKRCAEERTKNGIESKPLGV
jgi:hypothetical protein